MTTWNPLIHTWLFRGATEKLADASKTCSSVTGVFSKSFMLERCRETLTHSCASARCICLFIPSHINMSLASKSFTETLAKDSEWASYAKTGQSPQGWRIPHDLPLRFPSNQPHQIAVVYVHFTHTWETLVAERATLRYTRVHCTFHRSLLGGLTMTHGKPPPPLMPWIPIPFSYRTFPTKTMRIFIFREWGQQRLILRRNN